jgi:LemA protein
MDLQASRKTLGPGTDFARILAALAVASLLGGCGYNQILEMDEQARLARREIEVQLQRRSEMVPSLVETVVSYVAVDSDLVGSIADARARLAGAVRSGELGEMQAANVELCDGLDGLLALAGRYAELQADAGFQLLRSQLQETEDQVIRSGRSYNEAVRRYNDYIEAFPQLVTAKVVGAEKLELFGSGGDAAAMPLADE